MVSELAAVACVTVLCASMALLLPANAQFWGSWGNPQPQRPPPKPQPPQGYSPFPGFFGGSQSQQRETPVDYSRAPAPQKKPDPAAATTVVVVGDVMADWLASGLEDAFAEKPEVAVVRKHRTQSGLVRYDPRRDVEWAQVVKEAIAADKPKFIVMMVGVNDRQSIRERPATPAAAARQQAPARPATAEPASAPDPELSAQQSANEQNAELQEPSEPAAVVATPEPRAAQGNLGPFEFRSERWEAAYIRRIDATIVAMKGSGVPVFWVGLPSQRNTRASTDSAYLNDLFRQRAERASISYIDIWEGFVDDAGRFTQQGPDFEGQTRRLRAADGVYFTKPGARKLAHYVEREIQRITANRVTPVAMPAIEFAPATPGGRPSGPTRPLAGPVVPLTVSAGGGDELLGSTRVVRPATVDPVAIRVLTKGEEILAPSGRADDFRWPRGAPQPVTAAPPATAAVSAPVEPTRSQPVAPGRPEAKRPAAPQASTSQPAAPQATTSQPATPQAAQKQRPRQVVPTTDSAPRPPGAIRPSASVPQGTVR